MPKIKAVYKPETGLINKGGSSGVELNGNVKVVGNNNGSLDISRNITATTSLEPGVAEVSGSLLQLKGKAEGIHFHVGGNQYISSNAWFDPNAGSSGLWKYETSDSAAFRWGFVGSKGRFDLDYAVRGVEGAVVTGSSKYPTTGSWGFGLSMSASLGCITIGKLSGPRQQLTWGGSTKGVQILHGANATLDVTGSLDNTPGRPYPLSVAVTGSMEVGCGASDGYFMFPLHTNATRDALVAVEGMVIYNTETNKLNYRSNTEWREVSSITAPS